MSGARNAPEDPRDSEPVWLREQHMVRCEGCGAHRDEWEQGLALRDAVARVAEEPAFIRELTERPCPRCEHINEAFDVVIAPRAPDGELSPSRQRRFFATFQRMLHEGTPPEQIAEQLADEFDGAEAAYVRRT